MRKKISLWLFTINNLLLSQIFYQIYYRLVRKKRGSSDVSFVSVESVIKRSHPLFEKTLTDSPNLDQSLYDEYIAGKEKINWQPEGLPLLEKYHLHYFNFLHNIAQSDTQLARLLLIDWMDNNPKGLGPGWDPYPLSLRIGNEIIFYLQNQTVFAADKGFEKRYLSNLYLQADYLSHVFEFHLMANHLLENARALMMASIFFQNSGWAKKAGKVLSAQLAEQILTDGGHFEQSLLYQNIIFKHLLDLYAVLNAFQENSSLSYNLTIKSLLDEKLPLMWYWLIQLGDDLPEPPLLGDTALDMMYKHADLKKYFTSFFNEKTTNKNGSFYLKESGYAGFRDKDNLLIMDVGKLGPSYQPGHAHCDLLSITYHYKSQPIFVDSGLGNYLISDIRSYTRSMNAHNTVIVNKLTQAECWQAFRMARHVQPEKVFWDATADVFNVKAGYAHNWAPVPKRYHHLRAIRRDTAGFWLIHDEITGKNIQDVVSLFHLHPSIKVIEHAGMLEFQNKGEKIYFLWNANTINLMVVHKHYIPFYNQPIENKVLEFRPIRSGNIQMDYIISPDFCLKAAKAFMSQLKNTRNQK